MGLANAIAAAPNRLYKAIRHPAAKDAAELATSDQGFEVLDGHKYALLTTFKRDGDGVPTPVWFVVVDDKVLLHSEATGYKVKRARNDPRALIGPCTGRGKPLGPMIEGKARILSEQEGEEAERALGSKYGLGRRLYEGSGDAMGVDSVYLEVSAE